MSLEPESGIQASVPLLALPACWTLLMGLVTVVGFGLVCTGLTRAKNALHTVTMNFMAFPLCTLGFFAAGFALMGGDAPVSVGRIGSLEAGPLKSSLEGLGLLGTRGFFLSGAASHPQLFLPFLVELAALAVAVVIPLGAMAERWKFSSFMTYCVVMGSVLFPIFGHWVWGGGWLSQLGSRLHLGHGYVDASGSSVVHLTGGVVALVGSAVLGPRLGKFNRDGSPNPVPAHNVAMSTLGSLILGTGWLGFTVGRVWFSDESRIGLVLVNSLLSASLGAVVSTLWMWKIRSTKPDPTISANGLLAGLVASSAASPWVTPLASCFTGAIAGLLAVEAIFFIERRCRLDDPVGVISVHGVSGAWGALALGLFAEGSAGEGWNGIPGPIRGLLHGGGGQLAAQAIGIVANIVFVAMGSYAAFRLCGMSGGNRVSKEAEIDGLDLPEMGLPAYWGIMMDKSSETPSSR